MLGPYHPHAAVHRLLQLPQASTHRGWGAGGMRAPCASAQAALLALLLLASNSHAATAGAVLSPQDTYTVNTASGDFVLAPSVGWNGTLIRMMTTSVEACAEACRADQQCMLFNHCDVQVR